MSCFYKLPGGHRSVLYVFMYMYVYSYMYIMSICLIISIISIIIAICHVMLCYLSTYLSISLSLYIYIYIHIPHKLPGGHRSDAVLEGRLHAPGCASGCGRLRCFTANLRTNILDVRGFDSSIILILRREFSRS